MNNAPLVSVCIPVYNAEPFLEETLRSVVAQTYSNWEMVITEEGSNDGSRETIDRFIRETGDPRIKLHVNETRLGVAGNWNRGLSLAQGKYVKILCADDTLEPTCLEKQVAMLEAHPEAVMAACARRIINGQSRLLFERDGMRREGLIPGREAIEACFRAGTNPIGEPTMVLLRASSMQGMEWINPTMGYCVEIEFWLRLLLRGDLVYTREALASFRVHGKASTRQLEKQAKADFLRMVQNISKEANIPLSPLQYRLLSAKISLLNQARRMIYRLGNR